MARQSRLSHLTNDQLENMTAKQIGDMFYNGNTGAGYNALVARCIKPKAQETAKNADSGVKTAVARLVPVAPKATPPVAILTLPARVEEWLVDNILPEEWQDSDGHLTREIPRHFVELVVLSDTPDWNKRVRRLGQDEIDMLEAFLNAPATMNRREDALLAKRARAPFERSEAKVAHYGRIDACLESAENRFNASRYDAAITAFYAE